MADTFEVYKGDGSTVGERNVALPAFSSITRMTAPGGYVASRPLRDAVNVAIALGQPLLLTGEPGTGKTQLAYSIAHELEMGKPLIFNTKTTSIARDLFYRYDSLAHFHDAQLREKGELDIENYISFEALGKAIIHSHEKRAIVLIDEIDKAPRDLPNDILDVMEDLSFEVPEIGAIGNNRIEAKREHRPIVILTSNSEKNLPDAFLRRCVFFHIEFPNSEKLKEILEARTFKTTGEDLDLAIEHFEYVRQTVKRKKPSTAEFIAWMAIMENMEFDFGQLRNIDNINAKAKEDLKTSYSVLVKDKEDLKEL